MSDIDHSNSSLPDLADPTVTRLMVRRNDSGRSAGLLQQSDSVATSISVIVPAGGTAGLTYVDGLGAWAPKRIRLELLVMETPDDPGRTTLRDRLTQSGRSWRVIERPPGGRAAALSAAAQDAEHEFVLVSTGGTCPVDLVAPALSYMWAEGGDAALLDLPEPDAARAPMSTILLPPDDTPPTSGAVAPEDEDPAEQLAEWLGLSGRGVPGRLVLMRRWVARWLFNELTRAISPAEEVADRSRLLGIGIVRMSAPAPVSDTPTVA